MILECYGRALSLGRAGIPSYLSLVLISFLFVLSILINLLAGRWSFWAIATLSRARYLLVVYKHVIIAFSKWSGWSRHEFLAFIALSSITNQRSGGSISLLLTLLLLYLFRQRRHWFLVIFRLIATWALSLLFISIHRLYLFLPFFDCFLFQDCPSLKRFLVSMDLMNTSKISIDKIFLWPLSYELMP
jgi:hypothetical protein